MFVDVSASIAINPPRLHSGVAVADLDGDGRFEFIVGGWGVPNRMLRWVSSQLRDAAKYFSQTIFPVLTPLALDPGRPFPHISNLSLNLAVLIRDHAGEERFARLKVPDSLPQLVLLNGSSKSNGKKGRATDVQVGPPWAGTDAESCIKRAFIGEIVVPFEGELEVPYTVKLGPKGGEGDKAKAKPKKK